MRTVTERPVPARSHPSRDTGTRSRPLSLVAGAARLGARTAAVVGSLAVAGSLLAQTAAPPKHNNNTYGSPLDTIKSSRLWTDTPEPKDFVRDSRPDAKALDYTPLTGSDPQRPTPRDAANVAALQAELERAGAGLAGKAPHPRKTARPRREKDAAGDRPGGEAVASSQGGPRAP